MLPFSADAPRWRTWPRSLASRRLRAGQARLLAAVLAALGVWLVVGPLVASATAGHRPVVVLRDDVGAGQVLTAADLTLARYPAGLAPDGVLSDPGKAVGRRVSAPGAAGEPVTEARLVPTRNLKAGELALVIPLDAQTAGVLHPGDTAEVAISESGHISRTVPTGTTSRISIRILSLFVSASSGPLTMNANSGSAALVAVRSQDANRLAAFSAAPVRAVLIRPYP